MRKITVLAAMAAAVLFSGCAAIETAKPATDLHRLALSPSGTSLGHVQASNWGLYFFSYPLISGSTAQPGSIVFAEDTVTVKSLVQMVTKHNKSLGATKTLDMVSRISTQSVWLFNIREITISANAVK